MAQSGVSSLGITVSYGIEAVAGEKPSTFTLSTTTYTYDELYKKYKNNTCIIIHYVI